MPIKLAEIANQTKTIDVTFPGADGTLSVTYRPNKVTPRQEAAFAQAIRRAERDEEGAEPVGDLVLEMLSVVMLRWDLEGEDGQTVPLTVETLRDVPSAIVTRVMEAIRDANAPDPTKSAS